MRTIAGKILQDAKPVGMGMGVAASGRWLWFVLFFGLVIFPFGCGEHGGNGKSTWNGPQANQWSSGIPGRKVDIKVLLQRTDNLKISCRNVGYVFRLGKQGREILRLPPGQVCIISRRAGHWKITNLSGRDLLVTSEATTSVTNGLAGSKLVDSSCNGNLATDAMVLEISPLDGGVLRLGDTPGQYYRGRMRCLAKGQSRVIHSLANRSASVSASWYAEQQKQPESFAVINIVEIEQYLDGVVGCEMYSQWPMAALRSQSIAARTYALYQMGNRVGRDWDVACTQASQVYGGLTRENSRVREAVNSTRGVVLTYGETGQQKLFPAFFSAVCGGHTADGGVVFGVNIEPLRGHKCEYCAKTAPAKYYRWGPIVISKQIVSDLLIKRYSFLAGLEKIVNIQIQKQSDYGRVEQLVLTGINGKTLYLSAEKFRLAVSQPKKPLYSSWYKLVDDGNNWLFEDGRGWGHGVGMCQYGALGMAQAGKDCIEILNYYYPGARLVRAY